MVKTIPLYLYALITMGTQNRHLSRYLQDQHQHLSHQVPCCYQVNVPRLWEPQGVLWLHVLGTALLQGFGMGYLHHGFASSLLL